MISEPTSPPPSAALSAVSTALEQLPLAQAPTAASAYETLTSAIDLLHSTVASYEAMRACVWSAMTPEEQESTKQPRLTLVP